MPSHLGTGQLRRYSRSVLRFRLPRDTSESSTFILLYMYICVNNSSFYNYDIVIASLLIFGVHVHTNIMFYCIIDI